MVRRVTFEYNSLWEIYFNPSRDMAYIDLSKENLSKGEKLAVHLSGLDKMPIKVVLRASKKKLLQALKAKNLVRIGGNYYSLEKVYQALEYLNGKYIRDTEVYQGEGELKVLAFRKGDRVVVIAPFAYTRADSYTLEELVECC